MAPSFDRDMLPPQPPAVAEPVEHLAAPVQPPRESRGPVFEDRVAAVTGPKRPSGILIGSAIAGVLLVVVGILATLRYLHQGASATPPPAPVAPRPVAAAPVPPVAPPKPDSAHHDSSTAGMGFVHVIGDLPDDAVLWLDSTQQRGKTFAARPGSYNLEVETGEFEPWEKKITVRVADTTKVRVELELKSDSSQSDSTQQH